MIRHTLLALAAATALAAPAAHADPVYWSLNVGVPGVYGAWTNAYVAPPVVVAPPPRVVYYPGYAPVYGYPPLWHRDDDNRWQRWHRWHHEDDDD